MGGRRIVGIKVDSHVYQRLTRLAQIDEDGVIQLPQHTQQNLIEFLEAQLKSANELAISAIAPKPLGSATIRARSDSQDARDQDGLLSSSQEDEDSDNETVFADGVEQGIQRESVNTYQNASEAELNGFDKGMTIRVPMHASEQRTGPQIVPTPISASTTLQQSMMSSGQGENQRSQRRESSATAGGANTSFKMRGSIQIGASGVVPGQSQTGSSASRGIMSGEEDTGSMAYQMRQFATKRSIRRVFWMSGDFVVVVSHERTTGEYWLELFRFEQKSEEPLDTLKICSTVNDVKMDKVNNYTRQFAVLYFQEVDPQQGRVCNQTLFVLNSHRFLRQVGSVTSTCRLFDEIQDPGKSADDFSLSQGLRSLTVCELPRELRMARGSTFLNFDYSVSKSEGVLNLLFQGCTGDGSTFGGNTTTAGGNDEFSTQVRATMRTLKFTTLCYQVDQASLFDSEKFRLNDSEDSGEERGDSGKACKRRNSDSEDSNRLLAPISDSQATDRPGNQSIQSESPRSPEQEEALSLREIDFRGFVKVEMDFLQKKIIAVINLKKGQHRIIVYEDGHIQTVTHREGQLVSDGVDCADHLRLNSFIVARKCFFTRFKANDDRLEPVLVFESRKNEVAAFKYKGKSSGHDGSASTSWVQIFSIERRRIELQGCYGRILYGLNPRNRRPYLMEVGGKGDGEIITEMPFSPNPETKIDACQEHTNYLLSYEANFRKFHWNTFNDHSYSYTMRAGRINQLCGDYRVELCQKSKSIEFYSASHLDTKFMADMFLFKVPLPRKLATQRICTFLPVMNEAGTLMVLALRFESREKDVYESDKYSSLLLIDIERRKVQPITKVRGLHITYVWFETATDVIIQERFGIHRLTISRPAVSPGQKSHQNIPTQVATMDERVKKVKSEAGDWADDWAGDYDFLFESSQYLVHVVCDNTRLFGVRHDRLWSICAATKTISTVPVGYQPACTRECQPHNCSHFQSFSHLADFVTPQQAAQGKMERSYARFSLCGMRIYTLFANDSSMAWVSWFDLSIAPDSSGQDQITLAPRVKPPILVTKRHCVNIMPINQDQVCVQDANGFSVVNVVTDQIDFKVITHSTNCFDLTIQNGFVALPRYRHGVIMNFGCYQSASQESQRSFDSSFSEQVAREKRSLKSFNAYRKQIDKIYAHRFPGYYICLDEYCIDWHSLSKLRQLPVKIMMPDYIQLRDSKAGFALKHGTKSYRHYCQDSKFMDNFRLAKALGLGQANSAAAQAQSRDEQSPERLMPVESFKETTLLLLNYNARKTIWEQLILKGIEVGQVAINDNQLERICMANLNDGNQNLLHRWARKSTATLQKVFQRTSFSHLSVALSQQGVQGAGSARNRRFPFFLNFAGKSPLDIALDNSDLQTFKLLVSQLMLVQSCFASSHLVDNVIVEAVRRNLELRPLFESKICTQVVSRDDFEHYEQYPEFHQNDKKVSGNFPGAWYELVHSQQVLHASLGEAYSLPEQEEGEVQVVYGQTDSPIRYTVDAFLTSNEEEGQGGQVHTSKRYVRSAPHQLVMALAETKNMNVFSAGYIQRFIDQQWDGAYKWFLWLNLVLFSLVYAAILANVALVNYSLDTDQATYRLVLNVLSGLVICFCVIGFELRQSMVEKWDYFKDFNNWNDLIFFLLFFAYAVCDVALGSTWRDSEHYEVTRVLLSFLLLSATLKLLSLNRLSDDISFIVQMLIKVAMAIVPFLTLFISLIILFAFIVYTLGLSFSSLGDDNPYKDLGAMGYILFLFRTSTGDFDVDQFKELPLSLQLSLWGFWLMLVLINTIVFLNFLIAVIGDVYEQVMETRTEQIFKRKAQLLVEIQNVLGKYNRSGLAQMLVTRSSVHSQTENQWTGMLGEIKKAITFRSQAIVLTVQSQRDALLQKIHSSRTASEDALRQLLFKVNSIEKRLVQKSEEPGANQQAQGLTDHGAAPLQSDMLQTQGVSRTQSKLGDVSNQLKSIIMQVVEEERDVLQRVVRPSATTSSL